MDLVGAFVHALAIARRREAESCAELGAVLARWTDEARAAWPDLALAPDAFVAHVAARLSASGSLRDALAEVRAADAYLAAACSAGDARAMRALERRGFAQVDFAWRKLAPADLALDDARQLVREKLFVGGAAGPRIAEYAGRGALESWLRVTALRTLLDATKRRRRERPADDDFFAAIPAGFGDPHRALSRRAYAEALRAAFEAALATLSAEDRNVLRYTFVDKLGVDAIAAIYGVHRATAARRVARARALLLERLREGLARRLGVEPRELGSLVASIASGIELTLERLLPRT